ncbi:hypothetical protein IJ101_02785 [Candidatus Saccharibacteria bacterium]|nr:hypothetical protein [Candidatus Saccharibacteria bacterium]
MKKRGIITPNGVVLKTHENATAVFLTEQGFDVDLIPTSNIKGVHTPDIRINGLEWEMKAPTGEGKYLMANTIQRAVKQSHNVIVDLRHTKRHQTKCLRELENEFKKSGSLKRLKIITKSGKTIDFEK